MGVFVGLEADAVAEVVREGLAGAGAIVVVDHGEEVAAADAGAGHALDDREDLRNGFPGSALGVGGLAVHGEGAAVVGEVAAVGGSEVEDVELAGPGGAAGAR